MNTLNAPESKNFALSELCLLADLPVRTVRYYVQVGLVDKPEGETRAARYCARHLEQLLLIKKWTASGLSLERIRDLLQGEPSAIPPRPTVVGAIAVCSHITISDGVELVIDPGKAGWSPEQLRQFLKGAIALIAQMQSDEKASLVNTNSKEK